MIRENKKKKEKEMKERKKKRKGKTVYEKLDWKLLLIT